MSIHDETGAPQGDSSVARATALIGRRLAQGRWASGLSLTAAAALAPLPADTLQEIEDGTRPIPVPELLALLTVYGLDVREFLNTVQREFEHQPPGDSARD